MVHTCMQVCTFSSLRPCWRKGIRLHRSWSSWRGSGCYQTYLHGEEWDVWSKVFGSSDSPGQSPAATPRPAALLCHHALLSQLTLTLSSCWWWRPPPAPPSSPTHLPHPPPRPRCFPGTAAGLKTQDHLSELHELLFWSWSLHLIHISASQIWISCLFCHWHCTLCRSQGLLCLICQI